jgi:hypothetical protein
MLFLLLVSFRGIGQTLIDSYSESNSNGTIQLKSTGNHCLGQSFANTNSIVLNSCKFYLYRSGSPTGNATCYIYAHSGTYGTSSIPTGAALATSSTLDVSTLTTSAALKTFTFTGANAITLSANTKYILEISYSGGDFSNIVYAGRNTTNTGHGGNENSSADCSTFTAALYDFIFYVYGNAVVTGDVNWFGTEF